MTNTQDYYGTDIITVVKSFTIQTPVLKISVISLSFSLSLLYKLERLWIYTNVWEWSSLQNGGVKLLKIFIMKSALCNFILSVCSVFIFTSKIMVMGLLQKLPPIFLLPKLVLNREPLLKGKAQYGGPPCTKLIQTSWEWNYIFYETTFHNEEVTRTDTLPSVRVSLC